MENTWDEFYQFINAGDANLPGFQVALQRRFNFLSGFLKQIGFYANYTYYLFSGRNIFKCKFPE